MHSHYVWASIVMAAYLLCVCVCVCVYACLCREQPSRAFPCGGVGSWVPGRAAQQLSVFHRLDPSVGRQPCLRSCLCSTNPYRVDFTDRLIGALEAEEEKEGCDRRTNRGAERRGWWRWQLEESLFLLRKPTVAANQPASHRALTDRHTM